jgi:hypothetical protein
MLNEINLKMYKPINSELRGEKHFSREIYIYFFLENNFLEFINH